MHEYVLREYTHRYTIESLNGFSGRLLPLCYSLHAGPYHALNQTKKTKQEIFLLCAPAADHFLTANNRRKEAFFIHRSKQSRVIEKTQMSASFPSLNIYIPYLDEWRCLHLEGIHFQEKNIFLFKKTWWFCLKVSSEAIGL